MNEPILHRIERIKWFSRLGEDYCGDGIAIPNLNYWRNVGSTSGQEDLDGLLAKMIWLPTSRDDVDPFPVNAVSIEGAEVGVAGYRLALRALRNFHSPLLEVGQHDFNEAAKQAAAFAARAVARIHGQPSPWLEVLRVYESGHWPLGHLPGGLFVVF